MANKTAISPAGLFRTLADLTRLRILHLIGESEVCVCYFVEALRLSQPKISRHLAYLRRSGVVQARKEGKWVRYRIAFPENPLAAAILREGLAWAAAMPEAKRDRMRFAVACCQPQKFISLQGTPRLVLPLRFVEPTNASRGARTECMERALGKSRR